MPGSSAAKRLSKHMPRGPLRIPSFKSTGPPKLSRFIDELFQYNSSAPSLLIEENILASTSYYYNRCHPHDVQRYLREYKSCRQLVVNRCTEFQRRVQEEQQKAVEQQGAFDRRLRTPDLSRCDVNKIKYAWYAEKLDKENPKEIINREIVDEALERDIKKYGPMIRLRRACHETSLRTRLLKREADAYWSGKQGLGEDDDE